MVVELPGNHPMSDTGDAVSSNVVPAAYCKLECTEFCEHVSEHLPIGDDILHSLTAIEVRATNFLATRSCS